MNLSDYSLPPISKGKKLVKHHKDYKQISDRMFYETEKTFRGLKNPPKFSFIMRLVKIHGEEETVKMLGQLRENKNLKKITNLTPYIMGIFKKQA